MNESALGDTISNWDASKLGRLSYESPDVRDAETERLVALRGGDDIGTYCMRGESDSFEETLGRWRIAADARLSAVLRRDCLLDAREDWDCTVWAAYWLGSAGLGGRSTSVGEDDTMLGLRLRVGFSAVPLPFPLSCSVLGPVLSPGGGP